MALLAFSMMVSMNLNASRNFSLFSQVLWIASGVAVGLVLGVAVTRRQLGSLGKSETGKTIPAIAILLFVLGGSFILLASFLVTLPLTGFPTPTHLGVLNFVFCAGVGLIPTRTYLLVKWERNHKMRLYQKGSRFYAFPKPNSHDNQYSNR
jgi:protein-S-isoprenylcysteine O-methyltransferase Ste14